MRRALALLQVSRVKGFKKFDRVQGVIILVSFLAFLMVLYSNWVTVNMFKRSERWDPLPENTQFATTASRFALERAVGGGSSVQLPRDIQRPLDDAIAMCRVDSQARVHARDILTPVDDSTVKAAVGRLTQDVEKLREISGERFNKRKDSRERPRLEIT